MLEDTKRAVPLSGQDTVLPRACCGAKPSVHLPLQVSVEAALAVVFQPQAVFRVRPVSRCTASMQGALLSSNVMH